MTYLESVILGLVQGLAEFLPVSSSGHLTLLQNWFGIDGDKVMLFSIMLHLGTLVSVFVIFWKDIWELLVELVRTISDLIRGRGLHLEKYPVRKFGMMIIVATIPTAIIGYFFNDPIDSLYRSVIPVGIGLIITGFLLYFAEKMGPFYKSVDKMNFKNALFIGTIQGIATCPGISRSGSTVFSSLACKLDKDFAVKFIFILSIPSILGSAVLEIPEAIRAGINPADLGPIFVGMVMAFISGIFAIKIMIRIVSKKSLKGFSIYDWILGTAVILIGLFA